MVVWSRRLYFGLIELLRVGTAVKYVEAGGQRLIGCNLLLSIPYVGCVRWHDFIPMKVVPFKETRSSWLASEGNMYHRNAFMQHFSKGLHLSTRVVDLPYLESSTLLEGD